MMDHTFIYIYKYTFFFDNLSGLLRKSATQVRLYCLANYPSGEQTTARATLDKVWIDSWDNATHKDLLTPYIISCHIGVDLEEQPSGVSILTDPCECPSNNLRLRYRLGSLRPQATLTIILFCFKMYRFWLT